VTRDQAVDIIMARLVQRTDTSLRDKIIAELVRAQDQLERGSFLPWFLLSESSETSTTADEERVGLPSNFLREYEDGALYLVKSDGSWKELVKDDLDALRGLYPDNSKTGEPRYYSLTGQYFILKPVPDKIYPLRMRYYKQDSSLAGSYGDSNNIENQWLRYSPELLVGMAGEVIAGQYVFNAQLAQQFGQMAAAARVALYRQDVARQEVNASRTMGD